VVPDNQLSLAIGKEGQNARLAARISGWRIDIKSVSAVAAERATAAPAGKAVEPEEPRKAEEAVAVAGRPDLYEVSLEEVGLSRRVMGPLVASGLMKVGQLLEMGDAELLAVKGFGPKGLEEVREALRTFVERAPEVSPAVELEPLELGAMPEAIGEAALETGAVVEMVPEEEVVLYEAPPEQVAVEEKPQIRFKEDIFGERVVSPAIGVGKKGKKKKSREDRLEQDKPKKAKKARAVTEVDEEFDYSE
jgi:hypothetical protein